MGNKITMSRNNKRFTCEIIRSAHLSTGKNIYLLKRDVDSPFSNPFVVGVRDGDHTLDYLTFPHLNKAIIYYIDMIACYA